MRKTSNNPPYTFTKRGIYYFSRLVPHDIRYHYKQPRIVQSLRTRSRKDAAKYSKLLMYQLDTYWAELRINQPDIPCSTFLLNPPTEITLRIALNTYFSIKGKNRNETFFRHSERYINYLIQATTDKPIKYFTTIDATTFRNWLKEKGLANASIKKAFACIKAIFNLAIQEHGLAIDNPFSNIHLPSPTEDAKKRIPISTMDLKLIQTECMRLDDDLRWLVALISDTGMRLAEAAGLKIDDLIIDDEIPHIVIQPHNHRPLKTRSSERAIPLVGTSLWAVQKIKQNVSGDYCFPRNTNNNRTNANSASAALNKWIKVLTKNKENTIHGFRHSLRDRLRAADVGIELIDEIGGWSRQSVGAQYGNGYTLEKKQEALIKMLAM
jgi:integrase